MPGAPPLPSQIAVWMQAHVVLVGPDVGEPQWLIALKGTEPGDRMAVCEADGRGLLLVVDFASSAQFASGSYYAWGVITPLERPLAFDQLRSGVFRPERGSDLRWLRGGPKRLHEEEARRINALAGGLPPARTANREPRRSDGKEIWPGSGGLPPERITEELVATTRRVWRRIGFPSAPETQRATSRDDRPDLIAAPVVGEVKNQIRQDWGPHQIERYLDTLDGSRPTEGPWRGVLIHAERHLAEAAEARLRASRDADRIQVWGVYANRLGRTVAKRQF